jgi:fatty-acyl-CoA synthase
MLGWTFASGRVAGAAVLAQYRNTTQPTPATAMPTLATRPHHAIWPKRLPRTLQLPETSLWFNLEVSARRYPQKPAYLFFGQPLRYADLLAQAEALAGWLQAQGVQKGDRVAVFMQNCPQFVVAVHAVLRADAVVVPVNPMNKADELPHYITDPGTVLCITTADLAGTVAEANAQLPPAQQLRHILATRFTDAMPAVLDPAETPAPPILQWLLADPPLPAASATTGVTRWADALAFGRQPGHRPGPHTAGPDDLALLPYTSGTTGLPKGCMHTHRTLMHNVMASAIWGFSTPEAVSLGVVPMFHITGFIYGCLGTVAGATTTVMLPRWDRELAGRLIARHQVSHWTCIPTMIIDLFGSPNYASFDLSSLKFLSGGGAAMPQAVAQRLQDEFNITFAEGYGLTETAAPSHSNPPERAKLQCLGIPVFGTDSRIIDPGHPAGTAARRGRRDRDLRPAGVPGLLAPPRRHAGGLHRPRRQALLPHRRPGPHGRGRLFLHHRPAQAHDQRQRLQGVAQRGGAAAVQVPAGAGSLRDQQPRRLPRRDGEGGGGAARRAPRHRPARGHHRLGACEHMAAYKVPKIVQFADALPKSGSGKVMWRLLQEQEAAA